MNKDCSKVSIERGSDGRFTVLLTGSKDDIRMLWTIPMGPDAYQTMGTYAGIRKAAADYPALLQGV